MDATYIKMCEASEEVQQLWTYTTVGDRAASPDGKVVYAGILNHEREKYAGWTWLPYQHQLQAILNANLSELIQDFYDWNSASGYVWLSDNTLTSMEQLWLAFVMHDLYGKTWDGEAWTPAP